MLLNATNPGIILKNKTMALSYNFAGEHIHNNVVEARNIYSSTNFSASLTKPLVSNDLHMFYHECMMNE